MRPPLLAKPVTRRRAAATAGVVAVLALAGCGEGGGGGETALPKTEWLQQANAMCKELLEKWKDVDTPTDPAEAVRLIETLLADSRTFAGRFEALGPPIGDEQRYRESVEGNRKGIELAEQMVEALRDEDGPRMGTLLEALDALDAEGSALAREMGADDCARSPQSEGLR